MLTAAVLTGLVVLLFLGSWRSTIIIATSIPLCILAAIICLLWAGQTINVMTLGGLALAVGILVDDATVMIENIDTHLEMGKDLETAIIDAANQIVIPTLVSTLCICIVWTPLFRLSGVAGWLFMPMAEAIVFAMLASFILSRTLVPTMAKYLLAGRCIPACMVMNMKPCPKGSSGGSRTSSSMSSTLSSSAMGGYWNARLTNAASLSRCFWGCPFSLSPCSQWWGRTSSPRSNQVRYRCICVPLWVPVLKLRAGSSVWLTTVLRLFCRAR